MLLLVAMAGGRPMAGQPSLSYAEWATGHDLPQSQMTCALQDADGVLWFGSQMGLCRFDGQAFRFFGAAPWGDEPLSTNYVVQLAEQKAADGRRGCLWVETRNQKIYRFDPSTGHFADVLSVLLAKDWVDPMARLSGRSLYPMERRRAMWVVMNFGTCVRFDMGDLRRYDVWTIETSDHPRMVYDIYEDRRGREWLLTDGGVRLYGVGDVSSYPFCCIAELGDSIYLGAADGNIARFSDDGGLEFLTPPHPLRHVSGVQRLNTDCVCFYSDAGVVTIARADGAMHCFASTDDGAPIGSVFAGCIDREGELWAFATSGAIYRLRHLDGGGAAASPSDASSSDGSAAAASSDVLSSRGLRLAGDALARHVGQEGLERGVSVMRVPMVGAPGRALADSLLHLALEDADGGLWLKQRGRPLCWFDRATGVLRPAADCLPDGRQWPTTHVGSCFVDRQRNLWLMGDDRLCRVSVLPQRSTLWPLPEVADVTGLGLLPGGQVLFGSADGRLGRLDPASGRRLYLAPDGRWLPMPVALCQGPVSAFCPTPDGALWVATADGLLRLAPGLAEAPAAGSGRAVPSAQGAAGGMMWFRHDEGDLRSLSSSRVSTLYADEAHRLWIGTLGGGLNMLDLDALSAALADRAAADVPFYHRDNQMQGYPSLNFDNVVSLSGDGHGRLMVGTTRGLLALSTAFACPPEIRFYVHLKPALGADAPAADGLPVNRVVQTLFDAQGVPWVSTYGAGLSRIEPSTLLSDRATVTTCCHAECPEANVALSAQADGQGRVWSVSEGGLLCLADVGRRPDYYASAELGHDVRLTAAQPQVSADGRLWVGAQGGLLSLAADSLRKTGYVPPVVLLDSILTPDRTLRLHLAALDYRPAIGPVHYAFRLKRHGGMARLAAWLNGVPADDGWHVAASPDLQFTGLAYGTYTLSVRATNSEAQWSPDVTQWTLDIPWSVTDSIWMCINFAVLCLICLGVWTGWRMAHRRWSRRAAQAHMRYQADRRQWADDRQRYDADRRQALASLADAQAETTRLADELRASQAEVWQTRLSLGIARDALRLGQHHPAQSDGVSATSGAPPAAPSSVSVPSASAPPGVADASGGSGVDGVPSAASVGPSSVASASSAQGAGAPSLGADITTQGIGQPASTDGPMASGAETSTGGAVGTSPLDGLSVQRPSEDEIGEGLSEADRAFVVSLRRYVDAHLHDPELGVADLAAMSNVSRTSFFRRIKALTGLSPVDYIRVRRIEQAKRLIVEGCDTIAEIAYKVGYADPKYFSKCFRREVKCSPLEYRQMVEAERETLRRP